MNDILWTNFMDAQFEIDEGIWQNDMNHAITWTKIADTFAEML